MYAHENPEPLLMLKSIPLRENEEAEWVVRIVNVFYVLEKVSLYNENTFYSIIWYLAKSSIYLKIANPVNERSYRSFAATNDCKDSDHPINCDKKWSVAINSQYYQDESMRITCISTKPWYCKLNHISHFMRYWNFFLF